MDTSFSESDLLFRDEVKNFFSSAYDVSLQKQFESFNTYKDAVIEWQKRLYKQGWIAWPVKYGGTGWSSTQKFIFEAERASAGIREVMPFGLGMVGPVIYTFGNEKQKEHFLPRILKSEDWWCQGYSEPGSGSDLASLKTRAESDGDHYVVNGAKIWTSFAQYADWIFCLVRTSRGKKTGWH